MGSYLNHSGHSLCVLSKFCLQVVYGPFTTLRTHQASGDGTARDPTRPAVVCFRDCAHRSGCCASLTMPGYVTQHRADGEAQSQQRSISFQNHSVQTEVSLLHSWVVADVCSCACVPPLLCWCHNINVFSLRAAFSCICS